MSEMFEITKAQRTGAPQPLALWGPSNCGKTLSALLLARGIVGPEGNIGLIDTENRRAEIYADVAGGWDHLNLEPPFTPDRYTDAVESFRKQGDYGCIIIDSASHVWSGTGGVLDQADASQIGGLGKWRMPKTKYRKMVNKLLRPHCHIILCFRAKNAFVQSGRGKDATVEYLGLTPIIGDGLIYEMTLSVLLGPDHKPVFPKSDPRFQPDPLIPSVKVPQALASAIKPGEFISEQTGAAFAKWVSSGKVFDHELADLQRTARDFAAEGLEVMRDWWDSLDKPTRKQLLPILPDLRRIADEADEPEPEEDTDDPFAPTQAADDGTDPLDHNIELEQPEAAGNDAPDSSASGAAFPPSAASGSPKAGPEEPSPGAGGNGAAPSGPVYPIYTNSGLHLGDHPKAKSFLDGLLGMVEIEVGESGNGTKAWNANEVGCESIRTNGTDAQIKRLDSIEKIAFGK